MKLYNHVSARHSAKTKLIMSFIPDGGDRSSVPEHIDYNRTYRLLYLRLCSTRPSTVVSSGHRERYHYEQNRVPTVRENARIQSFPDNFIFVGSKTSQERQVGNAMPPLLAKVLADSLRSHL